MDLELMKISLSDPSKETNHKSALKRKFIEFEIDKCNITKGTTVVIDFQNYHKENDKEEKDKNKDKERGPKEKDEGFGETHRMTDVIRNIEKIYTGELGYLDGYDLNDPFIDQADAFTLESYKDPPKKKPKYGGFFINSGKIELIKIEEEEEANNSIIITPKQPKQKKKETPVEWKPIDEKTDEAVKKLLDKISTDMGNKIPEELDPLFKEVVIAAEGKLPKGCLNSSIVTLLKQHSPFTLSTLKAKLHSIKIDIQLNEKICEQQKLLNEIKDSVTSDKKIQNNTEPSKPPRWTWDSDVKHKLWQVVKLEEMIVKLNNLKCKKTEGSTTLKKKRNEKQALFNKICSYWPEGWMSVKKLQAAVQAQQKKEKQKEEETRSKKEKYKEEEEES